MKTRLQKLLIAIAGLLVSANAFAYDFKVDGICYNITSSEDRTVEVTSNYNSIYNYNDDTVYVGDISIPPKVIYNSITYSVTSIGDNAFNNCYRLTSVTIPNSVTSIGVRAFDNCYALTDVNISDLSGWCKINFYNQDSNPLYTANAVLNLNDTIVTDCLVIPNSVTSIGNYVFAGYDLLTSVTIPNSVTSIGYGAFYYCNGLTSISIPNSVTSIKSKTFSNCKDLTSVTIPNSVTSIDWGAFYNCYRLTSISIPNSVTTIGSEAFAHCTGLTSVTIPNSVTRIEPEAFYNCTGLKSVTIPNSVTTIGSGAFERCSNLTDVNISDLSAWYNIHFHSFHSNPLCCDAVLKLNDTIVTDLVIPNSVTRIRNYAFAGCSDLAVTIQNELIEIGASAFSCKSSIYCSPKTPPTKCDISAFTDDALMYSTLYVPLGCKSAYESVDPWRNFWNIVEMDFSDVEEIIIEESEYISVCVNSGEIVINNALNCDVTVYSLTGQPIYCNNEYNGESISLSKGIYIVKSGGKTQKVII